MRIGVPVLISFCGTIVMGISVNVPYDALLFGPETRVAMKMI